MDIITGKTGTNHVTSEDDRFKHAGIFGCGNYVLSVGNKLEASIIDSNTIRLSSGDIMHQGVHARIRYGEYEDVAIESGTSSYNRIDIIAAKYMRTSDGIESEELFVIKGEPTTGEAVAKEVAECNILRGDEVAYFPLYYVQLEGVNIESVTSVFSIVTGMDDIYRKEAIDTKLSNLESDAKNYTDSAVDDAKAVISDDIKSVQKAVVEQIESVDADLQADIKSIQQEIENLKTKVSELENGLG